MAMKTAPAFLSLVTLVSLAAAESAGGVRWTAPAGWKPEAERPMRAATYRVPAAAGDQEDGECAVFYFGPGQGGGVDANMQRWVGQFEQQQGPPQTRKQTINGLPVTTIDLAGSYTGAGGPMATVKTAKPGYRLLGGIVEAPQGAVFFKFTGPAKTVAAQQAAFQKMLNSIAR